MSHGRRILQDLADPAFRATYFEDLYNGLIAGQIRANREARDLTQAELADRAGMRQSAISRLEDANYESWSVSTLRRLARALDLVLSVRLVSFGEALHETERFDSKALVRPSYAADPELSDDGGSTGDSVAVMPWAVGRVLAAQHRFTSVDSAATARQVDYA